MTARTNAHGIAKNIKLSQPEVPPGGVPGQVEPVPPAGEVPRDEPQEQLGPGPDGVGGVEVGGQEGEQGGPVLLRRCVHLEKSTLETWRDDQNRCEVKPTRKSRSSPP